MMIGITPPVRRRHTTVTALAGRVAWNERDLSINSLSLRAPEGTLRADGRFEAILEDERRVGELPCHGQGGGPLRGPHQQVVDQPGGADRGHTVSDIVAQQPLRVRLILGLVPDADQ